MKSWLQQRWYARGTPPPLVLRPLAVLYGAISRARRRRLVAAQASLPVPVVIIGNISVGGTGKTPFAIHLIGLLRDLGFKPGLISRGYGGRAAQYPLRVFPYTDPALCGDEPLLIAQRTGVPVAVAPDRVAAARLLIEMDGVDVLVSDDGLQHYRLPRQREFCIVDGARGLGNGALLPAGPLREAPSRLLEVDHVVVNGAGFDAAPNALRFDLRLGDAVSVADPQRRRPLATFAGSAVHAVAGIGHPQRFFTSLEAAGLQLLPHPFGDHHPYCAADLSFDEVLPVLMTEKDAVKCRRFAGSDHWYVPVDAVMSSADEQRVRESLLALKPAMTPETRSV